MNYRFNMKRIALFLSFVIMAAACTDLAESNGKLTIDETALTQQFATAGGVAEVTFTTDCDWNVQQYNTNHYSWASITPTNGEAGENTIYITVLKNENTDGREFAFLLNAGADSKEIKVIQKQKDALTVTENEFAFDAFGGQFEIEVVANIDFEYEISADWITVVPTKALEATKISFDVAMNKNMYDDRAATVTVKSGEFTETITVDQTKFVPEWTLSDTEAWIGKDGGSCEFTFEANQEFEVIAPAVDWVTMTEVDGVYHFEIAPSTEYDTRIAYVNAIGEVPDANACAFIYQTGTAEVVWSHNLNGDYECIAHSDEIMSLGVLGNMLLIGDSFDIAALDLKTGAFLQQIPLPDYIKDLGRHSFDTDDAGHIVLGALYSYVEEGTTYDIYYADANMNIQPLCQYDGKIYNRLGNFRAAGDVTKDGVVTAFVDVYQSWAAWEFTNGTPTYHKGAVAPDAGLSTVWYPGYACVVPVGARLADGMLYCGYDGQYDLQYCTDPSANTWVTLMSTNSTWAEGGSGIAYAEFNGKKYAAIQSTAYASGADVGAYLVDITDPANAKTVYQLNAWEIPDLTYYGKCGSGDAELVVMDDAMYLYVVDGQYNVLTCVKFPKL